MTNVKQISIVLEADENFNELNLLNDVKVFLESYEVKLTGTHIKIQKKF